jgi:hypothetical protein
MLTKTPMMNPLNDTINDMRFTPVLLRFGPIVTVWPSRAIFLASRCSDGSFS